MAPLVSRSTLLKSKPIIASYGLTKLFSATIPLVGRMVVMDDGDEVPGEVEDQPILLRLGIVCFLVVLGGIFAGLTLGLLGLDTLHLRVLVASSDDPTERRNAQKVLKLLNKGRHWVLCVLLLSNVVVNESLPIFLDSILGGGIWAVVASSFLIVIFGEIIPQSVCVRYGLSVGAMFAPFVLCLMWLLAPIAYPLAKILDSLLGEAEESKYKKAELKSFLQYHREGEEPLRDDEITILNGVLSLNDCKAGDIMTPIEDVLSYPIDQILDHETLDKILITGFSRIPIHEPGNHRAFVGMLLIKQLLTYNPEDKKPIRSFKLVTLPEARPDINCFQALDYFQTGKAHMLLLSETPGKPSGAVGVVSLEDIIEEIIQEEIVDESDRFVSNRVKKPVRRLPISNIEGIIERRAALIRANSNPVLGFNKSTEGKSTGTLAEVTPDAASERVVLVDTTIESNGYGTMSKKDNGKQDRKPSLPKKTL